MKEKKVRPPSRCRKEKTEATLLNVYNSYGNAIVTVSFTAAVPES